MHLAIGKATVLLYLKVFLVDLLYVSVGCVLSWPSPLLGELELSPAEQSWVGSLMALGAALGPGLASWAQSKLGRKPSLMAAGAAFLASWVVLAASTHFAALCVGRVIGGAAMGVAFIGIPVYLTEISDVVHRQAVTTFTEFFLGLGYLLVYLGGPNLSYEAVQAVCAAVTLLFLASVPALPDSPVFLVSKGDTASALEVLNDLRKSEPVAQAELLQIQKFVEEEWKQTSDQSMISLLKEPGHMRALLLSLFALVLQQASGVIVVICYLEPILERIKHLSLDVTTSAVIIGCGNLPSVILSPPMARYLGTKVTLIICSAAMAVALICFTVYVDLDIKGYDLSSAAFVPILSLFFYNIFFCAGLGPLTWCVVAEISPPKIKGLVCTVSATVCWLSAFLLLLVFQPAYSSLGPTPVFGFFCACLVIGTVMIYFTLPDTKGLSLQEIQQMMTKSCGKPSNTQESQADLHYQ